MKRFESTKRLLQSNIQTRAPTHAQTRTRTRTQISQKRNATVSLILAGFKVDITVHYEARPSSKYTGILGHSTTLKTIV